MAAAEATAREGKKTPGAHTADRKGTERGGSTRPRAPGCSEPAAGSSASRSKGKAAPSPPAMGSRRDTPSHQHNELAHRQREAGSAAAQGCTTAAGERWGRAVAEPCRCGGPAGPEPRTHLARPPNIAARGPRQRRPRAALPPPRARLAPARHFHTSAANRGGARAGPRPPRWQCGQWRRRLRGRGFESR